MDLLMAEQVNQTEIAVDAFSPLRSCSQMVNVYLLIIEKGFTTLWTSALLSVRQLLFRERQILGSASLSFHPIFMKAGVIG